MTRDLAMYDAARPSASSGTSQLLLKARTGVCAVTSFYESATASSGVLSRQEPRELWLKARAGLPRKTLVEGAGRQRRVQPAPRALRGYFWMGLCSFAS